MLENRYIKNPKVAFSKVGSEMALMDLQNNTYFVLDSVGAVLWEALDKGRSLEELYEIVENNFSIENQNYKKDILEFIVQLRDKSLVKEHETILFSEKD